VLGAAEVSDARKAGCRHGSEAMTAHGTGRPARVEGWPA
jgi:hypothetical protein